eukprot:2970708-Amphidinium_carterae.1
MSSARVPSWLMWTCNSGLATSAQMYSQDRPQQSWANCLFKKGYVRTALKTCSHSRGKRKVQEVI